MRVLSLLLALASLLLVESQTTFTEVTPSGNQWSPRQKSNVEFITGSKTVRAYDDGTNRVTNVPLTNYFILYGGQGENGQGLNDVWVGNARGDRWYFVAGMADGVEHPTFPNTFSPSVENGHAQDSKGRQYRAAGILNGEMQNDVWSSPDGINWGNRAVTESAEFSPRYYPNLVCDSRDRLYLVGGITQTGGEPRENSNEVWRSVNGGSTWDPVEPSDPDNGPVGRGVAILLASGSAWGVDPVLLWMTGVNTQLLNAQAENQAYLADVWATKDNGQSWSAVTLAATFGRRDDSNAEITSGGLIVLAGGYTGNNPSGARETYNDVWVSANGGYSWGQCIEDAEWEDRNYLMTVLDNNGNLWVMGGNANGQIMGDIWRSTWSLNDNNAVAQRCGISIPSCGTGLKCWPGESTTLVSTDGSNVYCNSCPYSFGSSTASTLVVVFLVIFLIGFIISLGLLGYTYHKLRSAGAPSPIPLPASAQAWWNKSTASAVNGSTDSGATQGADQIYQPLRIRDQV